MHLISLTRFLSRWVTIGLALAFVVVVLRPDLLGGRAVVELREAPSQRVAGDPAGAGIVASYAEAVELAAPAVVNIHTSKLVTRRRSPLLDEPLLRRFFGDALGQSRTELERNLGSGVIVSPQGYVLTNNHVVEGADEIRLMLRDGRGTPAAVVGTDPETDLAVLKIELGDLPAITIAGSAQLEVGDVVLAIGNPFGVGQTVTMGIVSATGRNRLGINTFEDFIQTDAAINPGNSGGALVNAYGQLVGINTAIFSRSGGSQGIGFAIPVRLAKGVLQQILEQGYVARGWLGIEVQELTPALAESFGLDAPSGAVVAAVLRGGPGDRAGLEVGDVLTAVDGRSVSGPRAAVDAIAAVPPGNSASLSVVRAGRARELSVTVGQRPQPERD